MARHSDYIVRGTDHQSWELSEEVKRNHVDLRHLSVLVCCHSSYFCQPNHQNDACIVVDGTRRTVAVAAGTGSDFDGVAVGMSYLGSLHCDPSLYTAIRHRKMVEHKLHYHSNCS